MHSAANALSGTMAGMTHDDVPSGSAGSQTSPLQALRDIGPGFSGATARAAAAIVSAPGDAARRSITELARSSGVSPSTLSRLATQLGFENFNAMRAAIATEHGREVQGGWVRDIGTQIAADDEPDRVLAVLIANQTRAARNATASLDLAAAERAADWIAAADRILLYGDWGDSVALYELYLRLLRIGRHVWFQDSRVGLQMSTELLDADDVLVCLSRTGADAGATEASNRARERGARTVIITGDAGTEMCRRADAVLFTGTKPGLDWTEYFGGRISDTLTASLLWVLVAQRIPDGLKAGYGADTSKPGDGG